MVNNSSSNSVVFVPCKPDFPMERDSLVDTFGLQMHRSNKNSDSMHFWNKK